jgi:hypothetical protein
MANAEMHTCCEKYLSKRPFQGKVPVFEHKEEVKELCKGEGPMGWKAARWDADNKLWGTTEVANIPRLLASGKWHPVGIQSHWYGCLSQMAKAMGYFKQQVKTEKHEEKLAAINEQNEKERVVALEARKKRQAEEEERNKLKAMIASTDKEIQKMAAMGFDDAVPNYALRLETTFGPVAGMSPCGRVLRWMGFKMVEARMKAYQETGAQWLTPEELQPYYDSAQAWWVKALNEAAKRGDNVFDDPLASKRTTTGSIKRKTYEDPETGTAADNTHHMEVDTAVTHVVKKPSAKITPSAANFGAYCNTCHGTISNQFAECMCSTGWVPCYDCQMYVAPHQPCAFGHSVEYKTDSKPFF